MARIRRFTIALLLLLLGAAAAFAYHTWRLARWRADYARGVSLYNRGEYAQASGILQTVYNTRPFSTEGVDALCRVCVCFEETGRGDRAIESWEKVLASPQTRAFHPRALVSLARAAFRASRIGDAARYADAFLRDYPGSPLTPDALAVKAGILERNGDPAGALLTAREAAQEFPSSARGPLGELVVRILFSRAITPGSEEYAVRPGDSLQAIAKRYGTTVDLLRRMNDKDPGRDDLYAGERLKVCTARFSIVVDKSDNTLALLADGVPARIYPVGTGKKGSTPAGDFRITLKQEKPEWFRPGGGVVPYGDPGNLLGTRWMAIDCPGYGIHGTWEPETIGRQASAGCVRMLNRDVEELYAIVPVGTPVRIVE